MNLNDFFKSAFLPKNKQTNSTLLLVDFFSSFLDESEDTKNISKLTDL